MSASESAGPAGASAPPLGTGLDGHAMATLEEALRATLDAQPGAPVRFLAHRLLRQCAGRRARSSAARHDAEVQASAHLYGPSSQPRGGPAATHTPSLAACHRSVDRAAAAAEYVAAHGGALDSAVIEAVAASLNAPSDTALLAVARSLLAAAGDSEIPVANVESAAIGEGAVGSAGTAEMAAQCEPHELWEERRRSLAAEAWALCVEVRCM